MSAQASLHAQEAVRRALQRLEHGQGQESMADLSENSATVTAFEGAGGEEEGGRDESEGVGMEGGGRRAGGDEVRRRKLERRERRRMLLQKAVEEVCHVFESLVYLAVVFSV